MKKISIITPCFNASSTLRRTWASIKAQTIGLDALECIFVDDASTDNNETWDTLCAIENEAAESVKIIRLSENVRQGGARNTGLSLAEGKYLQFLDADDELYSPKACEMLYETAERTEADIIQFNHRMETAGQYKDVIRSREARLYTIRSPEDRKPFLTAERVNYGCWNKFYRMSLVRETAAFFPEHRIYEEPAFVYPQFLFAKTVQLIQDYMILYHMHPEQTMAADAGRRLTDHPAVQMELLEYCMRHPDLMQIYHNAIEYNFLWSFYLETIIFAKNAGVRLADEFMTHMRRSCRTLFPSGMGNPYIGKLKEEYRDIIGEVYRT